MGASGEPLGSLVGSLGRSWAVLGRSWTLLDALGTLLGGSWTVFFSVFGFLGSPDRSRTKKQTILGRFLVDFR